MTKIKGKINNIEQDLDSRGVIRTHLTIRFYSEGWTTISSPKLKGFGLGDKVELVIKKVG